MPGSFGPVRPRPPARRWSRAPRGRRSDRGDGRDATDLTDAEAGELRDLLDGSLGRPVERDRRHRQPVLPAGAQGAPRAAARRPAEAGGAGRRSPDGARRARIRRAGPARPGAGCGAEDRAGPEGSGDAQAGEQVVGRADGMEFGRQAVDEFALLAAAGPVLGLARDRGTCRTATSPTAAARAPRTGGRRRGRTAGRSRAREVPGMVRSSARSSGRGRRSSGSGCTGMVDQRLDHMDSGRFSSPQPRR